MQVDFFIKTLIDKGFTDKLSHCNATESLLEKGLLRNPKTNETIFAKTNTYLSDINILIKSKFKMKPITKEFIIKELEDLPIGFYSWSGIEKIETIQRLKENELNDLTDIIHSIDHYDRTITSVYVGDWGKTYTDLELLEHILGVAL